MVRHQWCPLQSQQRIRIDFCSFPSALRGPHLHLWAWGVPSVGGQKLRHFLWICLLNDSLDSFKYCVLDQPHSVLSKALISLIIRLRSEWLKWSMFAESQKKENATHLCMKLQKAVDRKHNSLTFVQHTRANTCLTRADSLFCSTYRKTRGHWN